jgi:hypothetical protein
MIPSASYPVATDRVALQGSSPGLYMYKPGDPFKMDKISKCSACRFVAVFFLLLIHRGLIPL